MNNHKLAQLEQEQEERVQILPYARRTMVNETISQGVSLTQAFCRHIDKIMAVTLVILLVLFFYYSNNKPFIFASGVANSALEGQLLTEKNSDWKDHENRFKIELKQESKNSSQLGGQSEELGNNQRVSDEIHTSLQPLQMRNSTVETQKVQLHKKRGQIFKKHESQAHLQYLSLANYNIELFHQNSVQRQNIFKEEKRKLQDIYHMSQFPEELSMCAVVYASGNSKPYSHQYVLNSLLNQQYDNYLIVYVADGHNSSEAQTVKQYISKIDSHMYVTFIWNPQKKLFLQSVLKAIRGYCTKKKITMLIDGDDQLLGHQVFRLLNTFYRRYNANLVYGNFIQFHQQRQVLRLGFSSEYQENQKHQNIYRKVGQKFGSLKSFKTKLIDFIKEEDFKDSYGEYYKYAGDYALIYPLLQLSCGDVRYLPEFNYLYYGYQIDPTFGSIQINNGRSIKQKKPYDCFRKYM